MEQRQEQCLARQILFHLPVDGVPHARLRLGPTSLDDRIELLESEHLAKHAVLRVQEPAGKAVGVRIVRHPRIDDHVDAARALRVVQLIGLDHFETHSGSEPAHRIEQLRRQVDVSSREHRVRDRRQLDRIVEDSRQRARPGRPPYRLVTEQPRRDQSVRGHRESP